MNKKIQILSITGLALLLAGIVLTLTAESLSTKKFNQTENSYMSQLDENRMRQIESVGSNLSLLGIALFVTGAAGWMTRPDAE